MNQHDPNKPFPNYAYGSGQPGPYTPPQQPQQPAPKKGMPTWAKVVIAVCAIPTLGIGACSALVLGGGAAQEAADDKAPVVSTPAAAPTTDAPPAAKTAAPKPPKPVEEAPSMLPEDGTLLVGKDVKPGTYQTRVLDNEVMPSCYWARLTESGEIIDNDIKITANAVMTVTVRASDYSLEVNCYGAQWKRVR